MDRSLEKQLPEYIYQCIKQHFIDENHKDWTVIANDIADNYRIWEIEKGVIATKDLGNGTLYFLEAKNPETPKLIWVFKMLAILGRIKGDKSVKKIYTHTKVKRVKDIMENRGWKSKDFSESAWEIYYENI